MAYSGRRDQSFKRRRATTVSGRKASAKQKEEPRKALGKGHIVARPLVKLLICRMGGILGIGVCGTRKGM